MPVFDFIEDTLKPFARHIANEVKKIGSIHYATRSEAQSSTVPVAARVISVTHNGKVLQYIRNPNSSALETGGSVKWGPSSDAKFEHWGLSPKKLGSTELDRNNGVYEATYVVNEGWADAGPVIQKAVNEWEGEITLHGFLRLDTHFDLPPGTSIVGETGNHARCGFVITNEFNSNSDNDNLDYVIRMGLWRNWGEVNQSAEGEPAGMLDEVSMIFEQPVTANTRSQLYTYPWAIDMSGGPRANLGKVRIALGTNGVNLVDDGSLGNPGGITIGDLELACFDENIEVNGAYDYVIMNSVRVWPFGFAGLMDPATSTAKLFSLWEDGNTIGWRHGKIDGFHCNVLALWNAKAIMGNPTLQTEVSASAQADLIIAPKFDAVYLDHVNSTIEFNGGKTWIGFMYNTCSGVSETGILCTSGYHTIAQIDARMSQTLALHVTGGRLDINGGMLRDWSPVNSDGTRQEGEGFLVEGGQLNISDTHLWWTEHSTGGRTDPVITQRGGGILTMRGNKPRYPMSTVTGIVKIENQNLYHHVDLTGFGAHTIQLPAITNMGNYKDTRISVENYVGSSPQSIHRTVGDAGEGFEMRFQRARGSVSNPTNVGADENLGDLSFDGYLNGDYRNAAIVRVIADDVVGNNPVGNLAFLLKNAAGNYGQPMNLSSGGTTLNGQTVVSGALDVYGQFDLDGDALLRANINHHGDALNNYTDGVWAIRHRVSDRDVFIGATHSTDGLFYPFKIDASHKRTILGEDETTPVLVKGPTDFEMQGVATDDIQFSMTSFRPHLVLQDKSTSATDWQIISDNGDLEFRHGDASTGTTLVNSFLRFVDQNNTAILDYGTLSIGASAPTGTIATRSAKIVIGDTDTGIAQNGDGILELWANNASRLVVEPTITTLKTNLKANGSIELGGNMYHSDNTSGMAIFGGTSGNGANIELYGGNHPSIPNHAIIDSDRLRVRSMSGSTKIDVDAGADSVTVDAKLLLAPVGTEGGELHFLDKDGNSDFIIDVDGSNNLRIRQGGNVVFNLSASGALSMSGVPEYASDSAADSGGVELGQFYVSTSTGALTKRRS